MPRTKVHAVNLGGTPDQVEAAFYEALQTGDLEKLMACWADEDEIVCVHPGGGRVVGPAAIRSTFEQIFSHGHILAWPEHVRRVESLGCAVHNLLERVSVQTPEGPGQAYVIATNVYHKTVEGWRLVAHHASPGTVAEAEEAAGIQQVLH